MNRCLAVLVAVCALTACSMAGSSPERSGAAVLVGVGDQIPSTFSDPNFLKLNIKRSRFFVPWNVTLRTGTRATSSTSGSTPRRRPAWSRSSRSATPRARSARRSPASCRPRVEYTKAFRAFRKRYPQIKVYSPWNEANHRSQPTWKNPKRAAQYYNIVRKYCRGCTIVAADVIDESNMESWLKTFKKTATKPKIWGLHNYRDTNKRKGQRLGGTKRLMKAVKGKVWLTETGGIVKFVLPDGRTLFKKSESRANSATKRMFSLAKTYRSRIKRLYIYQWLAPATAEETRFDAGLVSPDSKPRPAFKTVQRYLKSRYFNP